MFRAITASIAGCAFLFLIAAQSQNNRQSYQNWAVVAGGPEGQRYSRLKQINRDNVRDLELAWKYDSGDEFSGSEMQCNPIIVGGTMYVTTPKLRLVALDAGTGAQKWAFNPFEGESIRTKMRNRGVTYWSDGSRDARIFVAARNWLYAIDARTGQPVAGFGEKGRVDLRRGLGREPETLSVGATTPGVIYKDLLIIGSIVNEDLPSAPGDIRAYDVRTGAIRWTFHTIPRPGEYGYETWPKDAWKYTGGANSWTGVTLDPARGTVFVPTGSAAFDFYGENRHGDNLFANSLLALDASTGKRKWHFQFVHHDVWDRDLPAPPTLVRIQRAGRSVDAVAQITKSGFVFVFDRDSGKPLFPIEEREVPGSDVDGEQLARHQPLPSAPAPFARQQLTEDLLTSRTPEARAAVLERFKKVRSGPQFTPPSLEGTIVFPGFDGGGEWGGAAFDPDTQKLYVNANEMAWILRLVPRTRRPATARALYLRDCSGCHRTDLKGAPPQFPALDRIGAKLNGEQVATMIRKGSGRMPGFPQWSDEAISKVSAYLLKGEDQRINDVGSAIAEIPKYGIDGYNKFLDPDGYPAIAPPWGTLSAINLTTGDYAWKIPFGKYPELASKGLRNTGSENYGGPVVTAGGLLFIGATNYDRKFRAFDKDTGKLLWETELGAAGNATPAVYEVNGRQFVVIGGGGGKSKISGGAYYAFALPAAGAKK